MFLCPVTPCKLVCTDVSEKQAVSVLNPVDPEDQFRHLRRYENLVPHKDQHELGVRLRLETESTRWNAETLLIHTNEDLHRYSCIGPFGRNSCI